jgi:hypothetical protein
VAAAVAFAVGFPFYRHLVEQGGGRPLRWTDLTAEVGPIPFSHATSGGFSRRRRLLKALRKAVPGRLPALPAIDFLHRRAVLAAAGPRSSTGYDLRIVRVVEERSRIVVVVRELTPSLGQPVQARITYPYRLITIPRTGRTVTFEWQGRP